jgi:hypothetical protein
MGGASNKRSKSVEKQTDRFFVFTGSVMMTMAVMVVMMMMMMMIVVVVR